MDLPQPAPQRGSASADTDAVRTLLRRAGRRLDELETQGMAQLWASIEVLLDGTKAEVDGLIRAARADAESIRDAARADAARITADAQSRVDEIIREAEIEARTSSAEVLREAQQRLDDLLASERAVHDRIQETMTDLRGLVDSQEPPAAGIPATDPAHRVSPRRIA